MTTSQEKALDALKRAAIRKTAGNDESLIEIKTFNVKDHGRYLFVTVEAGFIGDENDMRSILCRYRGNFTVGPRGGIKSVEAKYAKTAEARRNARQYPLIYGFKTFGSE